MSQARIKVRFALTRSTMWAWRAPRPKGQLSTKHVMLAEAQVGGAVLGGKEQWAGRGVGVVTGGRGQPSSALHLLCLPSVPTALLSPSCPPSQWEWMTLSNM